MATNKKSDRTTAKYRLRVKHGTCRGLFKGFSFGDYFARRAWWRWMKSQGYSLVRVSVSNGIATHVFEVRDRRP